MSLSEFRSNSTKDHLFLVIAVLSRFLLGKGGLDAQNTT